MARVTVHEISKLFGGRLLFDQASFQIQEGARMGLVGRNGSGKTTLFRILLGEEEIDQGTLSFEKGYRMGHLEQRTQFTQGSVLEEVALALPRSEKEHLYKCEKILCGLGYKKEDLLRSPSEFSGGFQLRIKLAKVLVSEPDLLLLDEPTNYLDILSIRWLKRFLQRWPREFLLISHDRTFMDSVVSQTVGIHRQKLRMVTGNTEQYYQQIVEEEEHHERTRLNLSKKRKQVEDFVERFRYKSSKAKQAQSRIKMLEKMGSLQQLEEIAAMSFCFPYAECPGKRLLHCEDLFFGYDRPLIQGLSLEVSTQTRLGIIGRNGQGKSTLMKLLAGKLQAQKGTVYRHPKLRVGYFGQSGVEELDPNKTVFEEVRQGNPDLTETQVRSLCGLVHFSGDDAKKNIRILSGGERSRVLLGKILATPTNLLLLDEPTNHLDMEAVESLIACLYRYPGAVLFVTHDEGFLQEMGQQLVVFRREGQEFFDYDYEEFLAQKGWEEELPKQKEKKERSPLPRKNEAFQQRKMQKVEKEIALQEEELHRLQESLVRASEKQDFDEAQRLSQELKKKESSIEALYETLEELEESL